MRAQMIDPQLVDLVRSLLIESKQGIRLVPGSKEILDEAVEVFGVDRRVVQRLLRALGVERAKPVSGRRPLTPRRSPRPQLSVVRP